MTFYAESAAVAVELLSDFGQPITLTRPDAGGVYNPSTGEVLGNPAAIFKGVGAAFDYTARDIDGTLVKAGDRRIYIAPNLGATPATGDTVTLADGLVLAVIASRPLAPAGTPVLFDVQARGV